MFLKINRDNGDTSLFQCDAVHFEESAEKDITVLTVEKQNDKFCLYIDRNKYTELYLMNDNGKTIDSYRWSEDKATSVREEKTN